MLHVLHIYLHLAGIYDDRASGCNYHTCSCIVWSPQYRHIYASMTMQLSHLPFEFSHLHCPLLAFSSLSQSFVPNGLSQKRPSDQVPDGGSPLLLSPCSFLWRPVLLAIVRPGLGTAKTLPLQAQLGASPGLNQQLSTIYPVHAKNKYRDFWLLRSFASSKL